MTAAHTEASLKPAATADLMAVLLARSINDGERLLVGVNSTLPMVAALAAQRLHAPRATLITIAGAVNPRPSRLEPATTSSTYIEGSACILENEEVYGMIGRGEMDLVFLGAAQLDRHGQTNSSFIGPAEAPQVRFPGGGGAAYILPHARRVVIWRTAHTRRIFVENVQFVTARGNLDRVVTPLCVFRYEHGHLILDTIHPGVEAATVVGQTGFPIDVDGVQVTESPTDTELSALEAVDPERVREAEFQ